MNNAIISLPEKLENILIKDREFYYNIMGTVVPFSKILAADDLFFFKEYTDHGINHINNTLKYAENLIEENTFNLLSSKEVGVMVLSIVLHDIGMHTNAKMFKNMIDGKYDELANLFPNGKTWNELWQEFLYGSQYWGETKKDVVFGDPNYNIQIPDLSNFQNLTGYDKKLIGEFIRIYHCRIAHEIAIKGYIGKETIPFVQEGIGIEYFKIAGVVARSHGMNVRDTFDYLEENFGDPRTPFGIHAVYLMVLLRLADYLQIDNSRTNESYLKINTLYSPFSQQEHKTHLSIQEIQFTNPDKENIVIQASPKDAKTYVKIERLTKDIQWEFDLSWAILGEVYCDNNYKLRYRRISTNIANEKYKAKLSFVPQEFGFRYNKDLFKLLIAPLYSGNPLYGVRELVQNAVDACRACMDELTDKEPHVKVEVDTKQSLFTITDQGKGMNLYDIKNYFLTIGSSYNDNIDWKKTRDQNNIYRSGRFGIGVLAAFLLGSEITVVTRKRNEEMGYKFSLSLNDKFIQIDKVQNATFGTKIEIQSNKKILKELLSGDNNILMDKSFVILPEWDKWYIDEIPVVNYYVDGKLQNRGIDMSGYKELKHSSNLYGKVCWKPIQYSESTSSLYCNGFYICKIDHTYYKFHLRGFDQLRYLQIPDLNIVDKYNQLPLNLSRDSINEHVRYDFEKELAKEVFVDLLCRLMAFDENNLSNNTNIVNLHSYGFSLRSPFIESFIKEKDIIEIQVINRGLLFSDRFSELMMILSNYNILIQINVIDNMFYHDRINYEKCYDFLVTEPSISIAISQNYSQELKKNAQEKGWKISCKNKEIEQLFNQIIKLEDKSGFRMLSITYTSTSKKRKKIKTTIDALFSKYMNNDPVVPYKKEERRKKYPLLFKDYSKEIDYYVNNPKEI